MSVPERLQSVAVRGLLVLPALVFWPGARDAFVAPPWALAGALAAAGFAAWIVRGVPGVTEVPRSWRWLAACWLGWNAIRVWGSADPWMGAVRMGEWLVVVLAALAGLGLSRRERDRAADTLSAGAAIVSMLAVAEFVLGRFPLLPDSIATTSMSGRPGSTLGNPVFLGGWLAAVLPVLLSGGGRFRLSAALLVAATIVFTGSRGACLAAACGLGWVALHDRAVRSRLTPVAIAVALSLVLLAVSRPASLAHLVNTDVAGRAGVWRTAGRMIRSAPWAGVGTGGFGAAYPCAHLAVSADRGSSAWSPTLHAHNEYLHALAETGPVGLLLLAGFVVLLMRSRPADASGRGAHGGMIALAVCALFAFPLHIPATHLLWWMLPAVWLAPHPSIRPGRIRWPVALAGGVIAGLAAWGSARLLVRNADLHAGVIATERREFVAADRRFATAQRLMPDTGRDRIGMQRAIAKFAAGELGEAESILAADDRRFPCTAEAAWYRAFIAVMRVAAGQHQGTAAADLRITDGLGYGPPPERAAGFWTLRGHLRASLGDRRGATAAYRTALDLDPANRDARANLHRLGH